MLLRDVKKWDRIIDVAVVGSGGAGMAAAVRAAASGATVALLEKTDKIGGTTAVSGGILWIPCTPHTAEVDTIDSPQEALRYIRRLTLGREPDPTLLEVFVEEGPKALAWLEENTPLRMRATGRFADYYADLPGGKRQGRSLEPTLFDAAVQLGPLAQRLRDSPYMPLLTMEEQFTVTARGSLPAGKSTRELMAERVRDGVVVGGPALIGAMMRGALDRGVDLMLETSGRELVLDDQRRVVGLRVENAGASTLLGARRGVVLTAGGYEWNSELVRSFLGVSDLVPLTPAGADGDGLVMALEAGAAVANMNSAWWYPAMRDPTKFYEGKPLYHIGAGRNTAGTIVVNRHGRRFANEGTTYQDFPKSFLRYDEVAQEFPNQAPVWMIFDQRCKDTQTIVNVRPGQAAPDWMARGATIEELAGAIGVDSKGLSETLERFNLNAARGVDPDFHRGTVYWENFAGGGPTAATSIAPITTPPLYAVPIYLGTLGTNGGLRIDADARVRTLRGGIIEGLYAAGNTAASIFAGAYPGGGATIGPAVVFGYLAGRHAGSNPVASAFDAASGRQRTRKATLTSKQK